jgi:hypothetical protein
MILRVPRSAKPKVQAVATPPTSATSSTPSVAKRSLNSPIAEGQKSTMMCHLGNMAYRTNTVVKCDPKTGKILDNPEALKLWGREGGYRKGWDVKI